MSEKIQEKFLRLQEGILLHYEGSPESQKKAYDCFDYHASAHNNFYAIYWKAYYLYHGIVVKKNILDAYTLFKISAEGGVIDAYVYYALILWNIRNIEPLAHKINDYNPQKILLCMQIAANNENVSGMYYMGLIYLNGYLSQPRDLAKAKKWLAEASNKGHQKATQLWFQIISRATEKKERIVLLKEFL